MALTASTLIVLPAAGSLISQGMTALTLVTESYAVKKGDFVLVHAAAGGVGQVWTSTLVVSACSFALCPPRGKIYVL